MFQKLSRIYSVLSDPAARVSKIIIYNFVIAIFIRQHMTSGSKLEHKIRNEMKS